MIGVFPPSFLRNEQGLADPAGPRAAGLAVAGSLRRVIVREPRLQNAPVAFAQQDQTPSLSGQRNAPTFALPAPLQLENAGRAGYGSPIRTGRFGFFYGRRADLVAQPSEGAGPCLCVNSSLRSPRAARLPRVAIPSANKPLAARPSAPVRQPSPVAASHRGLPSVRQATSPIASLTPDAADPTHPLTGAHPRLSSRFSTPRAALAAAGLSAFIQRPRRIPHVQ